MGCRDKKNSSLRELELPAAVCSCLEAIGHRAFIVSDGDSEGLRADVLLLMFTAGDFSAYRRLLNQRHSKKPTTVLWQIDPLPPDNLLPDAELFAQRAFHWREILKPHRPPLSRVEKLRTLYRFRVWSYHKLSARSYQQIVKQVEKTDRDDVSWRDIRGPMENWHDILIGCKENWLDVIVTSTNQRRTFLNRRGITAHFVPVGAHDYMGKPLGIPRDIPIGFLGSIKNSRKKNRRTRVLEKLQMRLKEKCLPLIEIQNECYSEQRCQWLNRVRILINIYDFPWDAAWTRFLMAARCKTLVVSERTHDEHPLIPGIHYISATWEQMPEVIEELLVQPQRIDQITAAAENICRTELTLLNSVKNLHQIIEREKK